MSQGVRLCHYQLAKNYAPDETLQLYGYAYHIALLGGPLDLPQAFGLSLLDFYMSCGPNVEAIESLRHLETLDNPNRKVIELCKKFRLLLQGAANGSVENLSDTGRLGEHLENFRSLWSELGLVNVSEREALQRYCDVFCVHAALYVHTEQSVECVLALQSGTAPFISIERVEGWCLALIPGEDSRNCYDPGSVRTKYQGLIKHDPLQIASMHADQQKDELLRMYGDLLSSLVPALQAARGRLPGVQDEVQTAITICERLSVNPAPLHALLKVLRP